MKLAIRGHDLGKKGEFDMYARLKEFGFDGVQLVPYKTFNDVPYNPSITSEKAKEMARGVRLSGAQTIMLGAYFNPVHSVKEKVENGIKTFERYLELAKDFECDTVGSETGSFNDDKWTYNPVNRTDEALEVVVKTFKKLTKKAEDLGVFVAMEGASGHVCYSVERLKQAADEINSKNLRFVFDLYNYLDDGNYGDYKEILENGLKTFNGKIHCFHMKDCALVDGKVKQCAIGKGFFDYEWFISTIKKYDKDANLILEGTMGDDILPSVKLIRDIWKSV